MGSAEATHAPEPTPEPETPQPAADAQAPATPEPPAPAAMPVGGASQQALPKTEDNIQSTGKKKGRKSRKAKGADKGSDSDEGTVIEEKDTGLTIYNGFDKLRPVDFDYWAGLSRDGKLTEEIRNIWFTDTATAIRVSAHPLVATFYAYEMLSLLGDAALEVRRLSKINYRLKADDPKRILWKNLGVTKDKDGNPLPEDAPVSWTSICEISYRRSVQYINACLKSGGKVIKVLGTSEPPEQLEPLEPEQPPEPEQPREPEQLEPEQLEPPDPEQPPKPEQPPEPEPLGSPLNDVQEEPETPESPQKPQRQNRTAETKVVTVPMDSTVIIIPNGMLKTGDWEALYKFMDGNGQAGLMPMDATFNGLSEFDFCQKLQRFAQKVADAYYNGTKVAVVPPKRAELDEPIDEEVAVDEDALIEQYDPAREKPEGRPAYKVMITVTGSKLESTLKKAKGAFGEALLTVDKISPVGSRADQLADAIERVREAKDDIDSLKIDIESWHENLPDNFRDGEKGSQLEECVEALEQVISSLDDAESNAGSVEFPGMY